MRGIGVQQLDAVPALVAIAGAELEPEPGQDAEEGAVHQHTLGEVEHEAVAALLAEFVDRGP